MKTIKMLRNVEIGGRTLCGDSTYTTEDAEADALIADGSADLVSIVPVIEVEAEHEAEHEDSGDEGDDVAAPKKKRKKR